MASSPALAQQRQRGQGQRGGFGAAFGGGPVFLLTQKSVQDELKLSDEQVTKVKQLAEKQRESLQGLRDLSPEERRTKMQEQVKANEKAVADILNPDQVKRIKQISLQQQGTMALASTEVASALKLTDEQKDKLRSIQQDMRASFGQRGQGGRPSEEDRKKLEEARKAASEKVMNLLTAEQKTKWKEMTGEPFTGEIRRPQFGGRNRPNN
jgi:Spy/CpxP family protein refolding chaperone